MHRAWAQCLVAAVAAPEPASSSMVVPSGKTKNVEFPRPVLI
jgi:hypothetical protein